MDVSPAQGGNVKIDQTIPNSYPNISTVVNGKSVTFEAKPVDGFKFVGWSGSLTAQDDPMTNPMTLEITCSKNFTANFIQKEGFYLNMGVNGSGTVTPSVGTYSYTRGDVIKIAAVPNPGFQFNGWIGNVEKNSSASTTVIMGSSKTVIAIFILEQRTLTMQVKGAGSVYPPVGTIKYNKGSVISIVATPDNGYQFDGWMGDVKDTASVKTSLTLDSDKTIIANFSAAASTPTATIAPTSAAPVSSTPAATPAPTSAAVAPSTPAVPATPTSTAAATPASPTNTAPSPEKISPGIPGTPVTSNPAANKPISWIRGIGIAGIIVVAGIGVWLLSRKPK